MQVAQVEHLRQRHSLLRTTILSHPQTHHRLHHPKQTLPTHYPTRNSLTRASTLLTSQTHINTTNTHRLCAGATLFTARDPDPHAVDAGRILGVRIDVLLGGRVSVPYTLLLHRPHPALTPALRVHKHTVPPAVGLDALLERWLPFPRVDVRAGTVKEGGRGQDLVGLVRALRRRIVGWRRRVEAVEGLRGELGLRGGEGVGEGKERREGEGEVEGIAAVDAEGREARVEWKGGLVALMKVGVDGVVEACTVRDADGVESKVGQRLLMAGQDCTVASLGERIRDLPRRLEET
ncbi:MAG: hypothetical protein Q9165_007950 [Trypethelium subeluteriae]